MPMLTPPALTWKNEPCGRPSKTNTLALVMAAAASGAMPLATTVGPKIWLARVVPAVADAVAAPIIMPAIGASMKAGRPSVSMPEMITSLSEELEMMPASAPVPTSSMATPLIFARPAVK